MVPGKHMGIVQFSKKHWKKGVWGLAGLLLVVIGAAWYTGYHWRRELQHQLHSYVLQMTDSLYSLQYASMDLDILGGDLTLHKISLVPDTARYHRLQEQQRARPFYCAVAADKIDLQGFSAWRYFREKKIVASALVFTGPALVMHVDTRTKDTSAPRSFYQAMSQKLKEIRIGRLQLLNTNMLYTFDRPGVKQMTMQVNKLDIRVEDLLVDSVAQHDPARYLYSSNFTIDLKDYKYRSTDSMYWMKVHELHYNAAAQTLRIDSFHLEPMYEYAEFDKRLHYQNDRFDIRFNKVRIHGCDPYSLMEGNLLARSMHVGGGMVHVYHNRNLPEDPEPKYGKHPNQVLARLGVPLQLDSMIAKEMDVQYREVSPKTGETGVLDFKHASGVLTNITNIDTSLKRDNQLVIRLHALLMGQGDLSARFDFPINDSAGAFRLHGVLKNLDGRRMNPIVRPLNRIEISSLQVHSLAFNISGNQYRASGTVDFKYDSLKVTFLQQKEDTKHAKRSGLATFLANAFGLKNNSPGKGDVPAAATVEMERDPHKSFFNLVWKTIFKGVKQTAGTGLLKSIT